MWLEWRVSRREIFCLLNLIMSPHKDAPTPFRLSVCNNAFRLPLRSNGIANVHIGNAIKLDVR